MRALPGVPASPGVREALAATLARAIRQLQAKDLAGVLGHVSDDYRAGPMTKAAIRAQLLAIFQVYQDLTARVQIDDVRIVGEHAWIYSTGEILGRLPLVGHWMTLFEWTDQLEIARREQGVWRVVGVPQ